MRMSEPRGWRLLLMHWEPGLTFFLLVQLYFIGMLSKALVASNVILTTKKFLAFDDWWLDTFQDLRLVKDNSHLCDRLSVFLHELAGVLRVLKGCCVRASFAVFGASTRQPLELEIGEVQARYVDHLDRSDRHHGSFWWSSAGTCLLLCIHRFLNKTYLLVQLIQHSFGC